MKSPEGWNEYEWHGWLFRCRDGGIEMCYVGSRDFQPYDPDRLARPADEELVRAMANLEAHPT